MEEETHTHAIRRACFVTLQFWCNNWVIYMMRSQSDQDLVHRHLVQTKAHNFLQNVWNLGCPGWWHEPTLFIANLSKKRRLVQPEQWFIHAPWSNQKRIGNILSLAEEFQSDLDRLQWQLWQTRPHNSLQNVRNLGCSGWRHDLTPKKKKTTYLCDWRTCIVMILEAK